MQVTLIAPGSRGDVQPYVALGQGLKAAGHRVQVLTTGDFQSLVTAYGLEFVDMGGGVETFAQSQLQGLIEQGNLLKILATTGQGAQLLAHQAAVSGRAACQGSNLIVSGLGGLFVGLALSEKLGIPFLQAYQQARVINFLLPDPNARHGAVYNVQQALIAIGSGGLFGKGYGHGTQTQLRFLKVRHTDFIFSATSEEFGLVGGIIIILLLGFIVWRCIRAAQKAPDVSGAMIAFGVAILMFFQGSANIAVNLNLIPVSGLPLPFISYGGSGLMALMIGIGLVESVVMRHKTLEF